MNEIILCHEGEAIFSVNGQDYRLGKNCIIFIGNLESHSVNITKLPYDRSVVLLSHTFVNRYLGMPLIVSMLSNHLPGFPYVFELEDEEYGKIREKAKTLRLEYERKEPYWEELVANQIKELLITLYRKHPEFFDYVGDAQSSYTVMQVQLYINENFAEDITLEALAERFYTSSSTLSRDFKAQLK